MVGTLGRKIARGLQYRHPSRLQEVMVAVAASAFSIGLRLAIEQVVSGVVIFALTYPAVAIATLIAGWRSGLLTVLICQVTIWYLFLPVESSFVIAAAGNAVSLALTTFMLLIIVWSIHTYQKVSAELRASQTARAEDLQMALRELDHRTMNNFQLAAAVLHVEAVSQLDPAVKQALDAASGRIAILAAVHRELKGDAGRSADRQVKPLLEELIESLR